MLSEADTCRTYVLPKLYAAGWTDDQINEQRTFTDGRIMVAGTKVWRRPQKRADYTSIPTNVLFFDRSGPPTHVWYYEQPLPEGRKNYTKTAPIQFEEFTDCIAWWGNPRGLPADRRENDRAWKVPAAELLAANCNLDRKNPRAKEDITHLPPDQLAASILEEEQRIATLMQGIRQLLAR
ncbi:MAG: hypothetical protein FJ399_16235 [Verrucomicrobia bacterium]|nr:hypothetical protein [Verrucomicrobiota bacterium]